MDTKRQRWKLPKTFKAAKVKKGVQQRYDGEPRIYTLVKHANDHTLSADCVTLCCDCGLTHTRTYNVFRVSSGKWYLVERAYRVPGTGSQK